MTARRPLPPHPQHPGQLPAACPLVSTLPLGIPSISCSFSSAVPTNGLLSENQRAGDSYIGRQERHDLMGGGELSAICCPLTRPLRYCISPAGTTNTTAALPTNDGRKL
jgi:hypothetical protein